MSALVYKERLTRRKALFVLPCVVGVLLVSWNGRPLGELLQGGLLLTGLFLLSGVCAGCHVLAQKQVADSMDILDSNLTMFSISAVIALLPTLPPTLSGALSGVRPSAACMLALAFFGFITGIGFYLNAKAIPLVPFYMVPILQSAMAIFAILWGVLFFGEPVTVYVALGTLLFLTGIVGVQLADRRGA